jgi:hypothetical protein
MGANLFLKRSILVAIASALPIFGSFAAGSGGGHSSGGSGSSGGGHSSGGPSSSGGGHSSSASGGGHSSTSSNSGSSAHSSNSGHSSNAPKGSRGGDPAFGPAISSSRSNLANPSSPVRAKPVPVFNKQHFGSGYAHNDLSENDDQWRKQRRHLRHLFGFIPYWSSY